MATAQKTMDTILRKTSGTPLTLAYLTSIGEISGEHSELDVTTFESEDDCREFVAGLKDNGEVTFEGILKDETNFEAMVALYDAGTNQYFEIEFASGATYFLYGFVKSFKHGEVALDGVRTFTGSIRLSGKIEYASSGVSS